MKASRMMPQEEAYKILREGQYGVLSMSAKDGTPYGVPLNYFYVAEENAIYFHCAIKGRKLEYLKENNRVSFVVVGHEQLIPERFVTHYDSVILTGRSSLVAGVEEKTKRLLQLCQSLAPEAVERRDEVIKKMLPAVEIVKIDILEISGKRNRDD
ncbi:MAG: pyridoxamine 5'-phosphate oxidase family protein [Anaerolineae bacterium]|nr:pyridoxamine 5'-phosphate oxidase family protein [Anaerolineae bacterium]